MAVRTFKSYADWEERKKRGASNGVAAASGAVSIPMSIRELEVLLALCKAAPLIQSTKDAESLLSQLTPYMPEAHRQSIKSTSLLLHFPPWETLAFDLTSAVLTLAINHPSLAPRAFNCIGETIQALSKSAEEVAWLQSQPDGAPEQHKAEHALRTIQLAVSILGFLDAAAKMCARGTQTSDSLLFNVLASSSPKSSWSRWKALFPPCAMSALAIDL